MTDLDCTCSGLDWNDLEWPGVYRLSEVTARVPHVCSECEEEIPVGMRYILRAGLWDGDWQSFASCRPCERVRQAVCPDAPLGGLDEAVRKAFGVGLTTDPQDIEEE